MSIAKGLNMVQRRQFINAAHDPMGCVDTKHDLTLNALRQHPFHPNHADGRLSGVLPSGTVHHLPLGFFVPGPASNVSQYGIMPSPSPNAMAESAEWNGKVNPQGHQQAKPQSVRLLVLSDREQEAFARMDSVISQLTASRNLLGRRWYVEIVLFSLTMTTRVGCQSVIWRHGLVLQK